MIVEEVGPGVVDYVVIYSSSSICLCFVIQFIIKFCLSGVTPHG